MPNVQESYPTPTTGQNTPVSIVLTGTGVTQTPTLSGNVGYATYAVTLSVSGAGGHSSSVAVTAQAYDIAGTSQSTTGSYNIQSFNAKPSAANTNDVVETYPAPPTQFAYIATVGSATANPATVTAQKPGQAVVYFQYPAFNLAGTTNYLNGSVHAKLIVTVLP